MLYVTRSRPARRKDNTEQITFEASLEQQPENTALMSCRPLSLFEGWVLMPESLKEWKASYVLALVQP